MTRFRRILHPTDFSAPSRRAFTTALRLARADGAALTIVHVLVPAFPPVGGIYASIPPAAYEAIEAAARRRAEAALARLVTRARAARVRARGLLVTGIPHEQIVRRARQADLIVIGTHGRTGLPRLLLGSVAARVITLARRPVLTVRGR
jgi:nucleotide-binding universal stress UspA family protein